MTNYVCNIVSFKNNGSTISRTFTEFTQEQVHSGEMNKFIQRKTKAGYICIKANYVEMFKETTQLESEII